MENHAEMKMLQESISSHLVSCITAYSTHAGTVTLMGTRPSLLYTILDHIRKQVIECSLKVIFLQYKKEHLYPLHPLKFCP